jgi:hypothetical protein
MCHLRKETLSALILALSRKRPVLGSLLNVPAQRMRIGAVGKSSDWHTTSTRSSRASTTPSPSSKSLHNGIETAAALPCTTPSALEQWKTPSARWDRRSSNWGARTSGKMPSVKLTSVSHVNFDATARKTPPPLPCKTSPHHYHHLHPSPSTQSSLHSGSPGHRRRHHLCLLLPPSPGRIHGYHFK